MAELQTFAQQFARVLAAAGIKQENLATDIDVSQATISRWKTGERRPTHEQVEKIAAACSVTPWALVGGTELAKGWSDGCIVSRTDGQGVKWLGYFASALTGVAEQDRERLFRDAAIIREVCEESRALLYEPAHYTDPKLNSDLAPEQVYRTDHAQVSQSDFVVLHTRHPSFGAGQEIEIAMSAGVPLVLLIPDGTNPSRMVRGSYARVHSVYFRSDGGLRQSFATVFSQVVADVASRRDFILDRTLAGEEPQTLGARIKLIRTQMALSKSQVARLVGISDYAFEQLEEGWYPNPSLATLRRLAVVLRSSVSELVDGEPRRLEDIDPKMHKSKDNLRAAARELDTSNALVESVWNEFVLKQSADRKKVAEARTEPRSKDEWRTILTQRVHGNGRGSGEQGGLFDDV